MNKKHSIAIDSLVILRFTVCKMQLPTNIMRVAYKKIFPHTKFLYSFARNNISELSENVVDLGGGAGLIYEILLERGARYIINIDIDYELLSKAPISSDRILASSHEKVLRNNSVEHILLHDALHHFEKPMETLKLYTGVVGKCIHIVDFDIEKIGGKIIRFLEKMTGFPANFYSMKLVMNILEGEGLHMYTLKGPSKLRSQYYIRACKRE